MVPSITICIVHYNKLDKLRETVSRLQDCTETPFITRILNNGYVDEEISSYLSSLEQRDSFEIIYNDDNVGCPPGRHQLLQDIETEYVMTLDDDMYVQKGWLQEVLHIFDSDQDIGVVGVPYTSSQASNLRGGAEINTQSGVVELEAIDWDSVSEHRPFIPVDDVPGGTMILRTELLDSFNWDPQYFVGMGDIDKSMQILQTDWKQVMATGIQFEHDTSTDPEYLKTRKDYRERYRSYRKFVSKWGLRYPLRRHLIFNYFFRLPWPVMSLIETLYQRAN